MAIVRGGYEFARIAREHDALLYVDDAHGFGVVGERSPDELSPCTLMINAVDGSERYLNAPETIAEVMTVLGLPQRRFASIHVVGTNGKSSTVRFCAAILQRHGLRAGSYTSPHLGSFRERIEVGEEPVSEAAFAAAVQRAAHAAELVNRTQEADDRVTQFEALTAAAYHELARRGVEVAVIEAGLGGRFEATNVIPSKVQVLTTVGLEHTRWLGPTLTDIAEEKLAVVRDGGTLVVGELEPDVFVAAQRVAAEHGATLVATTRGGATFVPISLHKSPTPMVRPADRGIGLRAPGRFQRRNFALAARAAEAFLGHALDEDAVERAGAETRIPGRLDVVGRRPLTVYDGAHNPEGARALADSLDDVLGDHRPRVAVIGVLEDKDAAGMLEALLPQSLGQLARALAARPRVVLLEEPFAALDAGLRVRVREDIAEILHSAGTTALLVTHDQSEALSLADSVALLMDGVIAQHGTPADLYARPSTLATARFIGATVELAGYAHSGAVHTALGAHPARLPLPDGPAVVVLRPEQIRLGDSASDGVTARVTACRFYGVDTVVHVVLDDGTPLRLRRPGETEVGDQQTVSVKVAGDVLAYRSPAGW